jgi:hypothetical protein
VSRRGAITYPTGRLLGVIDDPAAAERAAIALAAGPGLGADDVAVLAGPGGRDRLGRLGPPPSPISRFVRLFQFLLMDQTPDFLVYERAIDDGRAVIAVHVADRDAMQRARAVLEAHGAHFLNHFGRLYTEEVSMWLGPEPEIPDALRR